MGLDTTPTPAGAPTPTASTPVPPAASTGAEATPMAVPAQTKAEPPSQELKAEAEKNIKENEAAERKALREKARGSQADKNWTMPTGGETYMMKMAFNEVRAVYKGLKTELKALKEQQAEKRKDRVENVVKATEELKELMEVIATDSDTNKLNLGKLNLKELNLENPNAEKLTKWKDDHPGKDYNKTLLAAIDKYREATGKEYKKPDKDGGQDPLSAIQDKAEKCVKHDATMEEMKKNAAAAEKAPAAQPEPEPEAPRL